MLALKYLTAVLTDEYVAFEIPREDCGFTERVNISRQNRPKPPPPPSNY